MIKLTIICLTQVHIELAQHIKSLLRDDYHIIIAGHENLEHGDVICDIIFDKMQPYIRQAFKENQIIIGFCATGIMIRTIAPLLQDKYKDPPILVIDSENKAIIPLLGGHHGANDIALKCAGLGLKTIITNQSSAQFALDNPPEPWVINDKTPLRQLLWRQAQGEILTIYGDDIDGLERITNKDNADIVVDYHCANPSEQLHYIPRDLVLGIGCARHQLFDDALDLWQKIAKTYSIDRRAIVAIATIDIKGDEALIHQCADYFQCPIYIFPKEILNAQTPYLKNPSQQVFDEIGCYGVCEAAALALSTNNTALLVEKQKGDNVTMAISKAKMPLTNQYQLGSLDIIGVGPGHKDYRHQGLGKLIEQADIIVGYGYYLDLIADLIADKAQHRFDLGEEILRVQYAISQAKAGQRVALICSGDPSIFAMASLVYEEIDNDDSRISKAINIRTHPGISAFQMAASLVGAPFGHDFAIISLSDLLTPRDDILKRVKYAALGDFAMAFYNPQSMTRRDLLPQALEIICTHQGNDIPICCVRHAGRDDQYITISRLQDFDVNIVDMMSIILVGNQRTKYMNLHGNNIIYTPRGYHG